MLREASRRKISVRCLLEIVRCCESQGRAIMKMQSIL
uniref:Uncharacterized protein n=1 Tax=Myoviridae sp. ctOyc4 TaxID=2827606 RepID=A0A8S5LQJ1_9CAUD|nr:MAG TPA: hypothetical protein [Myoviridae sp. ctOyc4]